MKLKTDKNINAMPSDKVQYCKRLIYHNLLDGNRPTILYGIIIEETTGFIGFRTANKNYRINKNYVTEISDTKIQFIAQPL